MKLTNFTHPPLTAKCSGDSPPRALAWHAVLLRALVLSWLVFGSPRFLSVAHGQATGSIAQPVVIGDTTVSLVRATSTNSAQAEWNRLLRNNPKVRQLIAFAEKELGARAIATPATGFKTDAVIRYTKGGVNTDQAVRTIFIPLASSAPKVPLGSAVLMVAYYEKTPQLIVPRLLLRPKAGEWHATEYSFRKDGRIWKMAAVFGDCLFRSSLKIVEQRNSQAHRSLRTVLNQTARPGTPLIAGLRQTYDLRTVPVGQKELVLATGIFAAVNVEEEYEYGYISGTLDFSFKPEKKENPLVSLAKKLGKDALDSLLSKAGKELWDELKEMLGLKESPPHVIPATIIEGPSGLRAATPGDRNVPLEWFYDLNAAGFVIEQAFGTDWIRVATVEASNRSFDVQGLASATDYQFAVRALTTSGDISEPSNIVSTRTADPGVEIPSGLRTGAASETSVPLAWNYQTTAARFVIEQWSIATGWIRVAEIGGNRRDYVAQGLAPSTDYQYAVRALSLGGVLSENSNIVALRTAAAGVETPSILRAGDPSENRVRLEWNYASTAATFVIEQWSLATHWVRIAEVTGAARAYDVAGLAASTEYRFAVRAISPQGVLSEPSNIVDVRTAAAGVETPSALRAAATGESSVHLEWQFNSAAATFVIEQWSQATHWIRIAEIGGSARAFDAQGLTSGTDYQYAVRAVSPQGVLSEHSNIVSVRTAMAAETPSALRVISAGPNQVQLTWSYTSSAASFIIEKWSLATHWVRAAEISSSARTFNAGGLAPSTDYQFAVRAVSPAGVLSEHSNIIGVRTTAR